MTGTDERPLVRRRGRRLSGEEAELWQNVARSVTPLRRRRPREEPPPPEPAPAAPAKPAAMRPAPVRAEPPPKPSIPTLETLGRRDRKRVASGRHSIDARIDLHGRTQAEAYSTLLSFIASNRARGARVVLVITGKGTERGGEGRGVLRRQVPMWLALPELRASVIGFEPAGPMHGGEGALYVRLRRPGGP